MINILDGRLRYGKGRQQAMMQQMHSCVHIASIFDTNLTFNMMHDQLLAPL